MPQPSDPMDPWAAPDAKAEPDALKHMYDLTPICIGAGLNGRVMLASHKETHEWVAVKPFSIEGLSRERVRDMCREIKVHCSLDHPNIVKATDAFVGAEQVHLVMEYLEGGDVLKHVLDQGRLSEQETRGLIKQLLQAIRYLHKKGVVHRDIKPENMAFESDSREKVKLIDFGLCHAWRAGNKVMHRGCGTKVYMAPEIFAGSGYSNKVDMWSLGVSVHVMLTGKTVGWTPDSTPVLSNVLKEFSWRAQQFVSDLMSTDPAVRPSAAEALRHPWFQNAGLGEQLERPSSAGNRDFDRAREGTNAAFAAFDHARALSSLSRDDIPEANTSPSCRAMYFDSFRKDFELLHDASSAWAPSRLMRLLRSATSRTGATARREPATQVSPSPGLSSPEGSPSSSSPEGITKVSISCTAHACSSSECSKKCEISTDRSSPWKMSL